MRLAKSKRERRRQGESTSSSSSIESGNENETQRRRTLSTYKIREPLAALAKEEEKRNHSSIMRMSKLFKLQTKPTVDISMQPIDLKSILKNTGGSSLVEILQQKNISLEDLLKGKQNALLALQPTTTDAITSTTKYVKSDIEIPLLLTTTPSTSSVSPLSMDGASEIQGDDEKVTTATLVDNSSQRKKILPPKLIKRRPMMMKPKNETLVVTSTSTAKSTINFLSVVKNRFSNRPKLVSPTPKSGGFFSISKVFLYKHSLKKIFFAVCEIN